MISGRFLGRVKRTTSEPINEFGCVHQSRGRGIRTPVNGFGDRNTATV